MQNPIPTWRRRNKMTEKFLAWLAVHGRHTTIHVAVVALLGTAAFIILTASDLGPMGPLVIALAFYMVVAAVTAEVALGITVVGRSLARRALRRAK